MFKKCNVPNIKYFKNEKFNILIVSETFLSKHELFQKCNVPNMKICFGNIRFKA